ncbi:RusA family crossover junction endodeoxyribonuclease [Candidatus Parcubacteria bacterium]|nr:MAG: RusA family crossover junction endodeoxyribonuclease [Candidatus Parcubacteria bacterium]
MSEPEPIPFSSCETPNILRFTIPGEPKAKQRARSFQRGSFRGTYTPKETVNYENHVKACFTAEHPDWTPTEMDVELSVTAFWPPLKSWLKSKKKMAFVVQELIRRHSKPDWDNVGKIISDALNGIAYRDDSQVTDAHTRKRYSPRPRVEVEMRLMERQ